MFIFCEKPPLFLFIFCDNLENMEIEIKRKIDSYFTEWKKNEKRLPLIIRGARQVGKTYSIRKFTKNFIHI